jgi:hypothetical protein
LGQYDVDAITRVQQTDARSPSSHRDCDRPGSRREHNLQKVAIAWLNYFVASDRFPGRQADAQSCAVNFCPELLIDLGVGVAKPTRCAKDLARLRTICRLPIEVFGTEKRAGGKRRSRDEDLVPRTYSIGVDPLGQSVQGNNGYHA